MLMSVKAIASNKLLSFAVAAISYLLLTLAALYWYQDDVDQMRWDDREVFNAKIIRQYRVEQQLSQQAVLDRLGSPDITAAMKHQQYTYQLLYYRTHRNTADGITTADECTALLFKNRILVAIGEDAVRQYHQLNAPAIK